MSSEIYEDEERMSPIDWVYFFEDNTFIFYEFYFEPTRDFFDLIFKKRYKDFRPLFMKLMEFLEACDSLLSTENKSNEELSIIVKQLQIKTIMMNLINSKFDSKLSQLAVNTYREMADLFGGIQARLQQLVGPRKNLNLQAEMFYARCIVFILEDKMGGGGTQTLDTELEISSEEETQNSSTFYVCLVIILLQVYYIFIS